MLDMGVVCRVILLTDTAIGLVNDSGKFVLDLSDPEIECQYSEPREVPELSKKFDPTAEQQRSSSLTFLFPTSETPNSPGGVPESVILMELIG